MKRILALLTVLAAISPSVAYADTPETIYGEALYDSTTYSVYAPSNAVGAPDNAYADFQDELGYVTLDFGEDGAVGNATLSYIILQYGASYQVDFLDADAALLERVTGSFAMYSTETEVPYAGSEPYRYVKVLCSLNQLWRLDAVASTRAEAVAEPVVETPVEEPTTVEPEPTSQGMLVKLVDDGDPNTTVDAAVYEIGADGMRHAFPSLAVYETWYHNFDDVAYIDADNLANFQLGANVTVRPGTKLVKIQSNTKVYAVGTDATLHWVTTEALAERLYGADWSTRVIDIPDTFWTNYTVGDPVTTELHPDGMLVMRPDGSVVYLGEETVYTLGNGSTEAMRFSDDDVAYATDADLSSRPLEGELTDDPNVAFPY